MVGELPVKRARLPILKVEGGAMVEAVICCDTVFAWHTHWVGSRSYVCPGEDCPACPDWECRWQGWLLVRLLHGQRKAQPFLIELSATTFDRFDGLLRFEGGRQYFGLAVQMSRQRRRSALLIEPAGYVDPGGFKKADPLKVWDALATVYGLPTTAGHDTVEGWQTVASAQAGRLLQRAVESARKGA